MNHTKQECTLGLNFYIWSSVQCDMKNSADSNDVFTFSLNQILRKLQQFHWHRIPENGSSLN